MILNEKALSFFINRNISWGDEKEIERCRLYDLAGFEERAETMSHKILCNRLKMMVKEGEIHTYTIFRGSCSYGCKDFEERVSFNQIPIQKYDIDVPDDILQKIAGLLNNHQTNLDNLIVLSNIRAEKTFFNDPILILSTGIYDYRDPVYIELLKW